MKKTPKTIGLTLAFSGFAAAPLLLPQTVQAQAPAAPAAAPTEEAAADDYTKDEDYEIGSIFLKSTDAMSEENWKKALFYLDRIISEYGDAAATDFGPKFGVMHYRRGFCLARAGEFEKALEAYQTCIEKFPNKKDTPADKKNPLVANAVLESAAIKQRQGDYEGAVKLYEDFQKRAAEAPEGSFSKAFFFIEAGTSYIKSGNMEKGMEMIERAFTDARGIGASSKDLFRGFLSLVEGWNEAEGDPLEIQKAAHAFIDTHADVLKANAYDKARYNFNPRLIEAGRMASLNGMHTLALRIFGMVASSSDVIEDLESRAAAYGGVNPKLQAAIDAQKAAAKDPEGFDLISLFGVANTYQQLGNFRAGFAVYDYLENTYAETPHRADILFGAFQCASAVNADQAAVHFGDALLTQFPDYKHRDKAIGLFVTKLFFAGDYEQALERATAMRTDVVEGSKEKEIVDFVIPGSLFYLGRYDESIPEISTFIETYPNSSYLETMKRLDGLGAVIKQNWAEASTKLDDFIKNYPKSKMIGDVLVDRAVTHYSLNQYPETLAVVQTLRTEHAGSTNIDRALNLAGDVYFSKEDFPKADDFYNKAREAADKRKHDDAHAHATAQLVSVANSLEKPDEVIGYYEEFFGRHEGNIREAQVAVGAVEALKAKGRMPEALVTLEKVIARTANSEIAAETDNLERAMNSYAQFFTETNGAAKTEQQLLQFPTHGMPNPPLLKSWLVMARIDLLLDPANKDAFPNPDAAVKVAYGELREFDKSILPPYILVKVGTELRSKGDPLEAVPWFEEVITRGEGEYLGLAEAGIAHIYAASGDPTKETQALAIFDKVAKSYEGTEYEEGAALGKADLLFKRESWAEAATVYQKIFENKQWRKDRPRVAYNMALSFEKATNLEMALFAYTAFFAPPYESAVEYSAEARLRAAEIQWNRGTPETKKKAYDLAKLSMFKMKSFRDHPVAGPHVIRITKLYKEWQGELGIEPDLEMEEGIQF